MDWPPFSVAPASPRPQLIKDHKFWIPLIGLYSGMRLGEILMLRVGEVREEGGVAYFDVNKDENKSVKSKAAIRKVPVHPKLIEFGFLQSIAHRKGSKPSDPLFPDAPLGDKKITNPFGKWFARYLGYIGMGDSALTFHSFRHTFIDPLREADVEYPKIQAIVGHAFDTVTGGYGKGYSLLVLSKEVAKAHLPLHSNAASSLVK